jgi:hypothetical protein
LRYNNFSIELGTKYIELNTAKSLIIVKKELYSFSNSKIQAPNPNLWNLVLGAWDLIFGACEKTLNQFIWHRYMN